MQEVPDRLSREENEKRLLQAQTEKQKKLHVATTAAANTLDAAIATV